MVNDLITERGFPGVPDVFDHAVELRDLFVSAKENVTESDWRLRAIHLGVT